MSTLVILNPYAGGGRARQLWRELEPVMQNTFPDMLGVVTETPNAIPDVLQQAVGRNVRTVIAVGGDGTTHAVVNQLVALAPDVAFGQIPIGTGQDLARALGIPTNPIEAVRWLATQSTHPIDLGQITLDDNPHYFLNIASAGVSGEVDRRMEHAPRYPWTFWATTVQSFLTYTPSPVQVWIDDEEWYNGRIWLAVAANGSTFGRGMKIAPDASVQDGQLDFLLVKDVSRLTAVRAFNTVYRGKHLQRPEVIFKRGQTMRLVSQDGMLPMDLDGEVAYAHTVEIRIIPQAIQMLYGG